MNCFFASCEIAENNALRGKKIAVVTNTNNRKSIILAASYEARADGVKTAMRACDAQKLCPMLILVESNGNTYSYYSRLFFDYLFKITPLVEPASIDEGYIDVTDCLDQISAVELAEKIQKELLEQFQLPCSIGIAPNKFLAKMASDMKKPLGITILRKREIAEKLWPLPVSDMQGVGKKTLPQLELLGIKTIGDLANYPKYEYLEEIIGKRNAQSLVEHANGMGSNEIDLTRADDISSISNSQTFDADEYVVANIKDLLKIITNMVSYRLEKNNLKAYTITMQIKYNNFQTISRARTLDNPIVNSKTMWSVVEDLFDEYYDDAFPVRLVGVAASKLIKGSDEIRQMSIFDELDDAEKDHEINKLIQGLQKSYGEKMIGRGIKASPQDHLAKYTDLKGRRKREI